MGNTSFWFTIIKGETTTVQGIRTAAPRRSKGTKRTVQRIGQRIEIAQKKRIKDRTIENKVDIRLSTENRK